jgi:hypothetical protein
LVTWLHYQACQASVKRYFDLILGGELWAGPSHAGGDIQKFIRDSVGASALARVSEVFKAENVAGVYVERGGLFGDTTEDPG